MSRKIWKFVLEPVVGEQTIIMPPVYQFLDAGLQVLESESRSQAVFWVAVDDDPGLPRTKARFFLLPTGAELPLEPVTYIGRVSDPKSSYAFFLFHEGGPDVLPANIPGGSR